MAFRNLEVVVTIKDNASKQLDKLNKNIKNTGKNAKDANVDFTKFNRTLFSTAAFIGTFVKTFSSLSNSLDQGSELDRLSNQFERVMGPKGKVFDAIKSMTDNSVDKMETMRQGLSLANLGIIRDGGQLANIVSKAGTAAKLAGKDSAEGIKAYSEFLKTGEISNLQFLDQIAKTNPALQAQMAILQKAGGVMGTVVSTQARLALGNSLLETTTKKALKGQRDFRDAILDIKQNFSIFRLEIGRLLLTALAPFIEKFAILFEKLAKGIDYIRQHEKHLVSLIKYFTIGTATLLGFIAAMGTFRLYIIALNSIGFGLPKLIVSILLLGSTFLGVTKKADGLLNKLRLFGAFIKGIVQLFSSFDEKTGLSKIDESLKKILVDAGIYDLVKNIARLSLAVWRVAKDIYKAIKYVSDILDSAFGGIFSSILNFIGGYKEVWDRWWIDDSISSVEKFVRSATIILGGFFTWVATKAIFGNLLGGTLSKIPIIGKFFGGKQAKGTKSDPIYVRDVDRISKVISKFGPTALADKFSGGILNILKNQIINIVMLFESISSLGLLSGLRMLGSLVLNVGTKFSALAVIGAGVLGVFEGLWESKNDIKDFLQGIWDITKAFSYIVMKSLGLEEVIDSVGKAFTWLKDGIVYFVTNFLTMVKDGWKGLIKLLAGESGDLGRDMSSWAKRKVPEAFKEEKNIVSTKTDKQPTLDITSIAPSIATPLTQNRTMVNPLEIIPKEQLSAIDQLGMNINKTQSSEDYRQQLIVNKALDNGMKPTDLLSPNVISGIADAFDSTKMSSDISNISNAYRNRTLQTNPLSSRESTTNYP